MNVLKRLDDQKRDCLICGAIIAAFLIGMLVKNKYYTDILINMAYYACIASAWNIMCGFAGQLSLGHVAFLGLGQYTCVLLYTRLGLTPWLGMILGSLLSVVLACFVGVLALRLKGTFFSLSTLALSTILQILCVKADNLTNGSAGITIRYEPGFQNMIFESTRWNYLLFIVLLFAILGVTIYIRYSKLGSNLIAIREDDLAASSLGINLYKNKVFALAISAFFTSMAGCLMAQYMLFINPQGAFNAVISQKAAILAIIGGSGTVFGPLIGSVLLTPAEMFLRAKLGSSVQGAYLIIYGVILIVVILTIPNGIVGTLANRMKHNKSVAIEKDETGSASTQPRA